MNKDEVKRHQQLKINEKRAILDGIRAEKLGV
jgi:hypothetical protein